ncbi:hypothetical protein E2I00_004600, partial [Balaenoptera physalus]
DLVPRDYTEALGTGRRRLQAGDLHQPDGHWAREAASGGVQGQGGGCGGEAGGPLSGPGGHARRLVPEAGDRHVGPPAGAGQRGRAHFHRGQRLCG